MANLYVIVFSVYIHFLFQASNETWAEISSLGAGQRPIDLLIYFGVFSSQLKYAHLETCVGDDLRPGSGKKSEFSGAHQ
jgi:hypothetical protein